MLFKAKIICLVFSLFGDFVQADFRDANEVSRQRGWLPSFKQAKGLIIQNQNKITMIWPEDSSEPLESLVFRIEFVVDPSDLIVMGEGCCSGENEGAVSDNDFMIECHFSGEGEKGLQIKTSRRLNARSRYQFHNGRAQPVDILQDKRAITHACLEADIAKRAEAGLDQQLNPKVEQPYLLAPDHHLTLAMQSVIYRPDTWHPDQEFENNLVVFPVSAGCQNSSPANNSQSNALEAMLHDHDYSRAAREISHFPEDCAVGAVNDEGSDTYEELSDLSHYVNDNQILMGFRGMESQCTDNRERIRQPLEGTTHDIGNGEVEHNDTESDLQSLSWLLDEQVVVNSMDTEKNVAAAEGIVALRNHSDSVGALMEVQDLAHSAAVLLDFKKNAPFDNDMKDAGEALLKLRKKKE